ncbi:hypothetical protein [Halioxenophilus aromaticivorans]|uniref:Phosphate-selective porin O and P n=1 Tax=Halioxenophilus aromaticivorans TaxID=1306992 RepID=A0AAV3U0Y3_9ALTE
MFFRGGVKCKRACALILGCLASASTLATGHADDYIKLPSNAPQPIPPPKVFNRFQPKTPATLVATRQQRVTPSADTATKIDRARIETDSPIPVPNQDTFLAISGGLVAPFVLEGSAADGGRLDSDQPYFYSEITAQFKRFGLYTTLWQDTESQLDFDEYYAYWILNKRHNIQLSYGSQYAYFGSYDTNLLSIALTEDLGSLSSDQMLMLSAETNNLSARVFGYRGEAYDYIEGNDDDDDEELIYEKNRYGVDFSVNGNDGYLGISWVSHIADADPFIPHDGLRSIPGLATYASYEGDGWWLGAEYIQALKHLEEGDLDGDITWPAKPSAWHIEIGLDTGEESALALLWSQSQNAEQLYMDSELIGLAYQANLWRSLYGILEASRTKDFEGAPQKLIQLELEYSF